ncbi:MAG: autotransporter domain-containing protein, partial [Pseudomonadota bacterium]
IFAQSVGGGGGKSATGAESQFLTLNLGGQDGSAGAGGEITVNLIATDLSTEGDLAAGVVAQSLGGGGGYAGTVQYRSTGSFGSSLDFGSGTSNSGSAADVSVRVANASRIQTSGDNAPGVFAQSAGGGGGVAGVRASGSSGALIGSAGGSGVAGTLSVDVAFGSSITTTGAQSHGIFAQSAGGRGSATSTVAKAFISVGGDVSATGAGSHGVYVQSSGNGRGDITVNIAGGTTVTGGGNSTVGAEAGSAIFIKDGRSNRIANNGTIRSSLGENGVAITATGLGTTQVFNVGTITGNIIGTTSTRVVNEEGASIKALDIEVGSLRNEGFLDLGPEGSIGDTLVVGNVIQTETGTIEVDVDPSLAASSAGTDVRVEDVLLVQGAADLDGFVKVDVLSSFQSTEGPQLVPVVIAEDGVLFAGEESAQGVGGLVDELQVVPSAVGQYELRLTAQDTVSLGYDFDFANQTVLKAGNDNQDNLATALEEIYRDGSLDEETALALIDLQTAEEVVAAYGTLLPEVAIDTQIASLNALRSFNRTVLSCANTDGPEAPYHFFDNGQCGYLEVSGSRFNRNETSDNTGFVASSVEVTMGGQLAPSDEVNIGAAFRYANVNIRADDAASTSDGDEFFFAVTGKRRFNAIEFSGSLGLGYGSYDLTRTPFNGGQATADQSIWSLSGQLRAAYLYQHENLFVMPRLGVGFDHFFSSSYKESGSATTPLSVDTDGQTYVSVQPTVKLGGEFLYKEETRLRPHLTLGITQYLGDATASATASFLSGGSPFSTSTEIDRTRYDIEAGLDVLTRVGATLRLAGGTSLSSNSQNYGGSLRLELPF